jgi:hypothetical protein
MQLRQTDPRSGRRYRKIQAEFIARSKATNAPCWLQALGHCVFNGAPIDYNAAGRTPKSPELHHKLPCATHPRLVYEPSNFACTHAKCNQTIGKRSPLARIPLSNKQTMHNHPDPCIKEWKPAVW